MPWMGRRSRPVTNAGHRRHSSIVESISSNTNETGHDATRKPLGQFQRLSLRLSQSSDLPFTFLTHEPEEIESEKTLPIDNLPQQEVHTPDSVSSSTGQITLEPKVQPETEPEQERAFSHPVKSHRFSLLKFRTASDSQLSTKYKSTDGSIVPTSPPPTIITTSPTAHHLEHQMKKRPKLNMFGRAHSPSRRSRLGNELDGPLDARPGSTQSLITPSPATGSELLAAVNKPHSLSIVRGAGAPPPYGDDNNSALAIPISRLSESSRSDGSSGDHGVYAQTTTTHTISTTTTFFRLQRRKKDKGPLFPLPVKIPPPDSARSSLYRTPGESPPGRKSMSPGRSPLGQGAILFDTENGKDISPVPSPSQSTSALTNAPFGSPTATVVRKESMMSARSGTSTPSVSLAPPRLGVRGRSSTMGSLGKSLENLDESTPTLALSGRTSTSTIGRKSFGDIFSLSHRLRHNSEPPIRNGSGNSPGTPGSKSNSLQIQREPEPELLYPEREESDTPASYIEKLEAAVPRGVMATILCKSADEFSKTCLRKYMRGFSYFGDSIDMAVRKMLMEVELPKETQQIDRLLAGFADRYHECNPGIFISTDETSIVAFSILLLHSDTHNKNNKRKMQKQDYVKNTQGPVQLSTDILECFYDNVCYTPFIHFEDEVAVNSHRLAAPKPRKSLIRTKSTDSLRGPVDPYTLILDNKLSVLRPSLKEVMHTEDTCNATGTVAAFDAKDLHSAFLNSGILQIVSARSRPDAFLTQATITNPAEAQAGLVSIKVAKVGLLWRKDPKKKKAKRPWQEWGAILTDSKLYFFRDVGWVKKLMIQQETHQRQAGNAAPLIFSPPLSTFEPSALMSMDDAVALMDSSYKKHKNAFVFIKHGGFEEIFLANSEAEMNDWLGKLNYAATFRTAGARMRGLVGGSAAHEGEKKDVIRKASISSVKSTESHRAPSVRSPDSIPLAGSVQNGAVDPQTAWEIMFYRRQIINERISDYEEKLAVAQKELDHLLRNARHLQLLLPIQAKTREAVVHAAGRMSAKLKWTRVEVWRTKCHRDILKADLEQEAMIAFPAPNGGTASVKSTPRKYPPSAPVQISQPGLNRSNTDTSDVTISPTNTQTMQVVRPVPQVLVDQPKAPESPKQSWPEPAVSPGLVPTIISTSVLEDQSGAYKENNPEVHALVHHASIVSSLRSRQDTERYVAPIDDSEEQVLRQAGLFGVDVMVPNSKRPDTSESEKDRVGAISADINLRDRGGSVRRSLHRTLRDSHHSHHVPSHHRSKKARDSGSSLGAVDDGTRSMSGESEELRRGTGSFIVHGKKASVVTFGTEWQTLSNEDRMKLRRLTQEEGLKAEGAVEDGTASTVSGPSTLAVESEGGGARSGSGSVVTARDERIGGDMSDMGEPGDEVEAVSDGVAGEGEREAQTELSQRQPVTVSL